MDVLELLVSHCKDVLVEKDGYERTGSLSVAICHNPCDLDLIDLILFANVQGIMVTDRKMKMKAIQSVIKSIPTTKEKQTR